MDTTSKTNAPTMNPSAYTHFLAKLETSVIRHLETREKMEEEGAAPEVLTALDQAAQALYAARDALRFAKALREAQMTQERQQSAALREEEAAARKAQAQAKKAAKAAAPAVTKAAPVTPGVPSDRPFPAAAPCDGPEGPTAQA